MPVVEQTFRIGQPVRPYYPHNAPDWLFDWPRHETLYVAGMRYDFQRERIDYTVSTCWPAKSGDLTDGWLDSYLIVATA